MSYFFSTSLVFKNEKKSAEHAIPDLYFNIFKGIKNNEKSECICLDFAKAFEPVNHEKFHHYMV